MGEIPLRSMQRVALNVRGGVIPDCGHWVPEERPDWLVDAILDFHSGDQAGSRRSARG